MAEIPANPVTQADLDEWSKLTQDLASLKSREIILRMKIFHGFFPKPIEGTNTAPLSAGWVIKATYPIGRKPDLALLTALTPELRAAGIPLDSVVRYKPEIAVGEYKKLSEEHRALLDRALEIKPGTPGLEIVQPKRATT